MSNTKINYLYREDASYKAYPEKDVIVADELFISADLDISKRVCHLVN